MSKSKLEYVVGGSPAPSTSAFFDVVFVHGLTGDYIESWTGPGGHWPTWLAEDIPNINVYSAGYDSAFFVGLEKGKGASLGDRATILLDCLMSRPKPHKPVIFIAHSLGGLIVKQVLRKSNDASSARKKRICGQSRCTIFVATPHGGTTLVKNLTAVLSIISSKSLQEMANGSSELIDLGSWFSNWAAQNTLEVAAYYELKPYNGVLVVDQATANPNVFGCDPTAVDADHVSITKLSSRDDPLYKSVICLIEEMVEAASSADKSGTSGENGEANNDYAVFTAQAPSDRRSLSEKLELAGRQHEVARGEQQKERFSMMLQRHIAQPSAVTKFAHLMSHIETRFHRHVTPAIAAKKPIQEIDHLIQDDVLDATYLSPGVQSADTTPGVVESAMYYLAGNCHIRWDDV